MLITGTGVLAIHRVAAVDSVDRAGPEGPDHRDPYIEQDPEFDALFLEINKVDSLMLMSDIITYIDQLEANCSYPPALAAADPVD